MSKPMDWSLFRPHNNRPCGMCVKGFDAVGRTQHSGQMATLGWVLKHCVEKKIPFVLTWYPEGAQVERIERENV